MLMNILFNFSHSAIAQILLATTLLLTSALLLRAHSSCARTLRSSLLRANTLPLSLPRTLRSSLLRANALR